MRMAEKIERRMTASCLEESSSSPVCFSVSHAPMKTNEVTRQQVEILLMNNAAPKVSSCLATECFRTKIR